MQQIKREFSFPYKLTHKVVRDLKLQDETIGELMVDCVGFFNPNVSPIDVHDRYSVEIDFIRWNGTDIKAVCDFFDATSDILDAATRYFANLIDNSKVAA